MPWSSNATFLVVVGEEPRDLEAGHVPPAQPGSVRAIYKPAKGERPLWDFPGGLYRREAAAYELAEWLGWHLIPRTIVREGPLGLGSFQTYVDADYEEHYFTLLEQRPQTHDRLREFAAFDVLSNNADRKGGHVLLGDDGELWGIDNGLCFHEEMKLRTVIWDFADEKVPRALIPSLERLTEVTGPGDLGLLGDLLTADECAALLKRARKLARRPVFPRPHSDHAYPWPMV